MASEGNAHISYPIPTMFATFFGIAYHISFSTTVEYIPAVVQAVAGGRDEARCIDLDPWAVYDEAAVVPDPLEEVA